MNYEEKRELRLQISQLLADVGLNQATIKNMVTEEIRNKVSRAIEQSVVSLNAECSSGDYIKDKVQQHIYSTSFSYRLKECVQNELRNKIIQVTLKDCMVEQYDCNKDKS